MNYAAFYALSYASEEVMQTNYTAEELEKLLCDETFMVKERDRCREFFIACGAFELSIDANPISASLHWRPWVRKNAPCNFPTSYKGIPVKPLISSARRQNS